MEFLSGGRHHTGVTLRRVRGRCPRCPACLRGGLRGGATESARASPCPTGTRGMRGSSHLCGTAKPFRESGGQAPETQGNYQGVTAPYFIPASAACTRPAKPEPLRAETDGLVPKRMKSGAFRSFHIRRPREPAGSTGGCVTPRRARPPRTNGPQAICATLKKTRSETGTGHFLKLRQLAAASSA